MLPFPRVLTVGMLSILLGCALGSAADLQSVMQVMVIQVKPATDTLWAADDPQTDAEWKVLDDAADATIVAFELTKQGGSGPYDDAWAANEDWQQYSDDVIAAAKLAKQAIAARDINALWEAGDPLYTPCEACHLVYHAGVAEH